MKTRSAGAVVKIVYAADGQNVGQCRIVGADGNADPLLDRPRVGSALQPGTVFKGIASNARHARWDRNSRKAGAAIEGISPYARHTLRNFQFGH